MKIIYRGYEIEVRREPCMAGYKLLYWSIFRESDGYECASGADDTDDTVRDTIGYLKTRVDAELQEDNPWGEKEDDDWTDGADAAYQNAMAGPGGELND